MYGCQGTLIVPEQVLPGPEGSLLLQQPASQQACMFRELTFSLRHELGP